MSPSPAACAASRRAVTGHTASSDRFLAAQRGSVHHPLTVEVIWRGLVHGAGVVEQQEVAHAPFVAINILRLRRKFLQAAEQRPTLLEVHALDVVGGRAD